MKNEEFNLMLQVPNAIISANWLYQNMEAANLIILDATIPKITSTTSEVNMVKKQIKGALFFDIIKEFSDQGSAFPNTVLSPEIFEEKVQNLGIQKDSCIVVYDDLGIYASPRVWWLFTLMGFSNIAVLDGGFPAWNTASLPIENPKKSQKIKGNFKANYQPKRIAFSDEVLQATKNTTPIILDARSSARFYGTVPEPRKEVRSGHIPASKNLPYTALLNGTHFKKASEIQAIFEKENKEEKSMIFSCGTGITASILALGAAIVNCKNVSVYDGSWTEWGSGIMPIEKS
jgi:thiosulfate/3-mercaptopyruvate sulfurtransferase